MKIKLIEFIKNNLAVANKIVLAIVVNTWGSSPRKIGSMMVVNDQADHEGSVSGGCVEADVISCALDILESNIPILKKYSVSDELAYDVGLLCGGDIEIFITRIDDSFITIVENLLESKMQQFYSIDLSDKKMIKLGKTIDHKTNSLRKNINGKDTFLGVLSPSPVMILIGGGEISTELARLSKVLGYKIIIIDPRTAFNIEKRFPPGTQIIMKWPMDAFQDLEINHNTAVIALSHDPKFDDTALLIALDSKAFYIGALGSIVSHQRRLERLKKLVEDEKALSAIKSPVGLDIFAQNPQEIAVSILADVIRVRNSE